MAPSQAIVAQAMLTTCAFTPAAEVTEVTPATMADVTSTSVAEVTPAPMAEEAKTSKNKAEGVPSDILDKWLDDYILQTEKAHMGSQPCEFFKLGFYITLGRENACSAEDLINLFWLIYLYILVSPLGKPRKNQIKDAIARAIHRHQTHHAPGIPSKKINSSKYNDNIFSNWIAKRFLILMFHVRRLKRNPTDRDVCATQLSEADQLKLTKIMDALKYYKTVSHIYATLTGPLSQQSVPSQIKFI